MGNEIAIVGCGPAGMSAAIALHDAGHRVSLYERFEEAHPVGSGLMLQPTGLEVLSWLGLREQVELLGQKISGMLGKIAGTEKVVLDIRYSVLKGDMYGVAIHRSALFHVLYEAMTARHIPVHTNSEITGLIHGADNVTLVYADGSHSSESYNLIVDASGRQSQLVTFSEYPPKVKMLDYGALWGTVKLEQHGFNEALLEQRYEDASIMVGILPCGELAESKDRLATFFWSIKSTDYETTIALGLEQFKKRVLVVWPAVAPLLEQITHFDQLNYARYSHHTLKKPYGNRIAFVGDAAHSTSPQLGQGVNMALLDIRALTAALNPAWATEQGSNKGINQALAKYASLRRNHVRLFQLASLSLTPLYQSDGKIFPWLRDTLFQPLSKIPLVAWIMTSLGAGLLASPLRRVLLLERSNQRRP